MRYIHIPPTSLRVVPLAPRWPAAATSGYIGEDTVNAAARGAVVDALNGSNPAVGNLVNTALDRLQQREPALAAQVQAQIHNATADSLNQAATTLLATEPWLAGEASAAGQNAGSGFSQGAWSKAAPWLLGAVVVAAGAYYMSSTRRRSERGPRE